MRLALTHPLHGYYTSPSKPDQDLFDEDENESHYQEIAQSSADHIFGKMGDFTTAPEVSQVFGECVLVWFMTQYEAMGSPSVLTLVEVGPGRGTLMADILKSAIQTFPKLVDALSAPGGGVHLVENSRKLRKSQYEAIAKAVKMSPYHLDINNEDFENSEDLTKQNDDKQTKNQRIAGVNTRTLSIRWHDILAAVPCTSTQFLVAQEFIDALPVHSFQKTKNGVWRERMVDVEVAPDAYTDAEEEASRFMKRFGVAEDEDDKLEHGVVENSNNSLPSPRSSKHKKPRLRFVLAKDVTPALRSLMNTDQEGRVLTLPTLDDAKEGDVLEVCPEGMSFVQDVANRLNQRGGAALIVDYGSAHGTGDSVRAFYKHHQVHPLSQPGQVDVTADVDFAALKMAVRQLTNSKCQTHGPVSQGNFLASMGAVERVEQLVDDERTTDKQATDLYLALERLLLPEQMGERYKVMALCNNPQSLLNDPPAAF